ncbi:MAG: sirohydrochlorin cobaltochelatase [Veillonella sp.]|uniref:sirohydrochlorin cobaltochelatase n=1 Tax=Veillonella sp. TaxID=1926307 RepID=UPI0025EABC3F|nr:sirohydrochlorin cobaltochelatase [Veillonella sp.]MBS4913682.1 sirohydrochlorin cobaltochelatase [Veillonella sp.]
MKKQVFKYSITVALTVAALVGAGFVSNPVSAAYTLSSEVKTATPALLEATQIGLKTYNTTDPVLMNAPNKDAIVVMSFGTTFKDTRDKTITATVNEIQEQHPNVKVVTAFTSHIIIDRIKAKEGITYPTPEEALDQLKAEGYTRVALTTLDVIPGIEYNYKAAVFNTYKQNFKKMTFGTPLMYWMGQEDQADDVVEVVKATATQFPKQGPNDAVLIMAHGTPDPSNAYYSVIQDRIDSEGLKNTYIYTVEGNPRLENIIPILKAKGINHVTLMPFMMVAGDHANNDMAGDEPDSHKSQLIDAGFTVDTYIHGLGENQKIRDIYSERADEAWKALQAPTEAE